MVTDTITIHHPVGLHARPAALFVTTSNKHKCVIKVTFNGKTVNAKSLLGLLSLGAGKGSEITISAEGEDENNALQALRELVKNNFGE